MEDMQFDESMDMIHGGEDSFFNADDVNGAGELSIDDILGGSLFENVRTTINGGYSYSSSGDDNHSIASSSEVKTLSIGSDEYSDLEFGGEDNADVEFGGDDKEDDGEDNADVEFGGDDDKESVHSLIVGSDDGDNNIDGEFGGEDDADADGNGVEFGGENESVHSLIVGSDDGDNNIDGKEFGGDGDKEFNIDVEFGGEDDKESVRSLIVGSDDEFSIDDNHKDQKYVNITETAIVDYDDIKDGEPAASKVTIINSNVDSAEQLNILESAKATENKSAELFKFASRIHGSQEEDNTYELGGDADELGGFLNEDGEDNNDKELGGNDEYNFDKELGGFLNENGDVHESGGDLNHSDLNHSDEEQDDGLQNKYVKVGGNDFSSLAQAIAHRYLN